MTDITEYVVKGIVSRVQAQVADVSGRVYSFTPQNAQFPFISFEFITNNIPTKGVDFLDVAITFHIFCQRGTKSAVDACLDIARALHDALDGYNTMALDTGDTCLVTFDGFQQGIPEDDGKTYQIVTRYKILASN